ncbi:MAG: DNA primase small subunit PriS, partial [Thermoplasmata archaeon]|nr:DNA primase small subunit PriS [Thermoplasmata archaeon]
MGKTVVLEGDALEWARARFRTYYGTAVLDAPKALARREFALFPFTTETMMRRHTAFPSVEEFRGYIRREVPRHAYYSSAYYERPDHPKMPEKEWLGADLIFDLDADHLRDAAGLDYAGQLELVKGKVRDLIDDFLIRDFGVDPAQLQLVFSGGRGYHVHVQEEAYSKLGSPERREIVDYILGNGVDPARALSERRDASRSDAVEVGEDAEEVPGRPRRRGLKPFKRLPPVDAPGWAGRISRSFHRTLQRWVAGGAESAAEDLVRWGVDPREAKRLARQLVTDGTAELKRATIEVQGETDAPVTTDLHRLIRLPGSLHGGTGFRVRPIPREGLDRFDPFRDAVAYLGKGTSEVELTEAVD